MPVTEADDELGEAFEELYRRDYVSVVGLVYALSGSRWAAEGLAQDAFTEAHRAWATVGSFADPGAWVRKVAMNRARSAWRRRGAEARALLRVRGRRVLPAELPAPAHDFWAAVRALPNAQAQVIALHYVEDRSVDDIADLLGVAPGTVKTHLFRARRALAQRLGVDEGDNG
jgi:RNA polymerase sigma-70 factor (ECF subfamily)